MCATAKEELGGVSESWTRIYVVRLYALQVLPVFFCSVFDALDDAARHKASENGRPVQVVREMSSGRRS